MPALVYPLINGVRPDFAKMALSFNGTNTPIPVPIIGFDSLSYKTDSNGELVHGAAQMGIGQTAGQQTPSASCSMYLPEYSNLIGAISLAGEGYMTQLFNILVSYNLGNGTLVNDMLYGCRIKSDSSDHRKGGTALTVNFDLQPIYIVRNGILPNDDFLNVTAAYLNLLITL
jgi:hypothetical protein